MDPRQKVKRALGHQDGPVPIDFGGTAVTGMHVSVVAGLRDHYGLEKRPVSVIEPYQMLGRIDGDLQEALGVDVVGIYGRTTMFGFALGEWKESQGVPVGREDNHAGLRPGRVLRQV